MSNRAARSHGNWLVTMAKKKTGEPAASGRARDQQNEVAQLRVLAHDLSNALEAILQASYLLGQARLDESSHRWAQLIEKSSGQAVKINRELRRVLRSMSEGEHKVGDGHLQ